MCSGSPNFLGDEVVAKCGSVYEEYGLDPRELDKTSDLEMIIYDLINFNDVLNSGLTVFQIITLEGWARIMYNY